jgi:hypothetical protein
MTEIWDWITAHPWLAAVLAYTLITGVISVIVAATPSQADDAAWRRARGKLRELLERVSILAPRDRVGPLLSPPGALPRIRGRVRERRRDAALAAELRADLREEDDMPTNPGGGRRRR